MKATGYMMALVILGIASTQAWAADEKFASFKGCVYNSNSGRPIPGALVFVQSLGSPNGAGSVTGPDGCVQNMLFNVDRFPGDYIEASYEYMGRKYMQQYHIPNGLIEQTYSYDFFLDVPIRPMSPRRPH